MGGGPAGINTATQLVRSGVVDASQVTIVDGSTVHHYKPGWTLYCGEDIDKKMISMPMRKMIPSGVRWLDYYVQSVEPGQNSLTLANGDRMTYDQLVLVPGLKFDYEKVKGFKEALNDPTRPVSSVYAEESHEKLRKARSQKYENAIFAQPQGPINCGAAPQKILHLTMDAWDKKGFKPHVSFIQADPALFGSKFYAQMMKKLLLARGVEHLLGHNLVEIKPNNVAIFEVVAGPNKGQIVEREFDFLHTAPPMCGPDFLRDSGLVNSSGFIDVDKHTFRHKEFDHVWSIGDASSVPTSKTQSAVFEQSLLLVQQLDKALNNPNKTVKNYDGYSGCPVITSGGKIMLAEFGWDGKISPTFYKDQRTPTRFFYWLKKYLFPYANNYLMPRGLWKGRKTLYDPTGYDYLDFEQKEIAKLEPSVVTHADQLKQ